VFLPVFEQRVADSLEVRLVLDLPKQLQMCVESRRHSYADRIVRSKRDRDPDSEPPARFDDLNGTGKKGAYRTLRTQVLEELVARDYVAIDDEQVGRADLLTLTPTGTAALRAFRHKILDVVEALEDHRDVDTLPPWLSQGLYGES
jgi:hypothetical protein